MTRQVPHHIKMKVARLGRVVAQAQEIAEEIELWCEANGVTADGYDYCYGCADTQAYGIRADKFYKKLLKDLNRRK